MWLGRKPRKRGTYDILQILKVKGSEKKEYVVPIQYLNEKKEIRDLCVAVGEMTVEAMNKLTGKTVRDCFAIERECLKIMLKQLDMAEAATAPATMDKEVKSIEYKLMVNGRTVQKAIKK